MVPSIPPTGTDAYTGHGDLLATVPIGQMADEPRSLVFVRLMNEELPNQRGPRADRCEKIALRPKIFLSRWEEARLFPGD